MNLRKMLKEVLASGMSQNDVATEIGYTQQYVSAIVLGNKGKRPSHKVVTAITALHNKRINK